MYALKLESSPSPSENLFDLERIVVDMKSSDPASVGAKAFNLYRLQKAGFTVPEFFVISPEAFWQGLTNDQIGQLRHAETPSSIKDLLTSVGIHPAIKSAMQAAVTDHFGRNCRVAVRSSALEEDSDSLSCAGQLESYLNIEGKDVSEYVLKVWLSAFSERYLHYRTVNGLNLIPEPPAVIIQRMIAPDNAGVAFSVDPVTLCPSLSVVSAVAGSGDAICSGEASGDTYYVDTAGTVWNANPEATDPIAAGGRDSTITKRAVATIARHARNAQRFFGAPQDVEWAMVGGRVYILQSRPITSIRQPSGTAESIIIWDNSNIGESYHGVTTPLTFSFARTAYEHVYRQFCRIMGVHEKQIEEKHGVFSSMIGYIHGRIYYNLLNWYRLIAILPGYRSNRRFMEQMMGVKHKLPQALTAAIAAENSGSAMADKLALCASSAKSLGNLVLLPLHIARFNRNFEKTLALVPDDLSRHSLTQLSQLYRQLEERLLPNWQAPLTNDFYAMIFYGVLKQICGSWLEDKNGTLQNAMLGDIHGIISTEPARYMRLMAQTASSNPALIHMLKTGSRQQSLSAVRSNQVLSNQFDEYIAKFGDRCSGELKLETSTLRDDPTPLLRSVGVLAENLGQASSSSSVRGTGSESAENTENSGGETTAQAALRTACQKLRLHPIKLCVLLLVVHAARCRIQQRENLRFQRTRLFGAVRRIFKEIGKRFHSMQLIDSSQDIFFLEVGEVFATIDGTTSTSDIKQLVRLRKRENDKFLTEPAPPNRFEVRGVTAAALADNAKLVNLFAKQASSDNSVDGNTKPVVAGIGCCPGRVTGRIRILHSPHLERALEPGQIVLAERTDPGWILVFPQAAGLLVEHGSLLSHSAIVSRELGLPCIVSVPNATSTFHDGELIEMDGTTGEIRRIGG